MRADNLLIALLLFTALLLNACNTKESADPVMVPDSAKAGKL